MGESKLKPKPDHKAPAAADVLEHYFLIAGNIVFTIGEEPTPISAACNAVVRSIDGRLGVAHIARAQQALQGQFHKKIGSEIKLTVVDVVITAAIPLGVFTQAEFNKLPEGMVLVERPPVNAPVNKDLDQQSADAALQSEDALNV